MSVDATEVRVALRADLYVAVPGTSFPANPTVAPSASWVHLGHHDPESAPKLNREVTREEIRSGLSAYAVRIIETEIKLTSTFTLIQRNAVTWKLAFGGGTIVTTPAVTTGTTAPEFHTWTPPPVGDIDERAFLWRVTDGDVIDDYRLYRGLPLLSGELEFGKKAEEKFPIGVGQMEDGSGNTWKLVSTDPAMSEA